MMFRFIQNSVGFLPPWLGFGSVILLLCLAFGCGVTSLKQQIPIDTTNLLPKELAVGYLQTVLGKTQPNEEGMLLTEFGRFGFGIEGTKNFKYQELGVTYFKYTKHYYVNVHRHVDSIPYSHAELLKLKQDRAKAIKICTALVSLGVQNQDL